MAIGVAWLLSVATLGCSAPPDLFPMAAVDQTLFEDGSRQRWYDVDGNGSPEFRETLNPAGLVTRIAYDHDEDGQLDESIFLPDVPAPEQRHLLIILDSVPFKMVTEAQTQGRLAYFPAPSAVISTFPVMTDPALTEFFGMAPCPAVEAEHFDGRQLRTGWDVYTSARNMIWMDRLDYTLVPIAHILVYLNPYPWYDHELSRTQSLFLTGDAHADPRAEPLATLDQPFTATYVVTTSSLGANAGRNGHAAALVKLDRLCQRLIHRTHGRARITLMSDHGHDLGLSKRVSIREQLGIMGYRVGARLDHPDAVVVPEWGMVTCAALHTRAPERVARDCLGIQGVELTAYASEKDGVTVLSRTGQATITRKPDNRFRYVCQAGDPLQLKPILYDLRRHGHLGDGDGTVAPDELLFQATARHLYPDAVYRLWRAFHGLFVHQPDVFVSLDDGWMVSNPSMAEAVTLLGAHGSLRQASSTGFACSMAGPLPRQIRMNQLRHAMIALGVPFPPTNATDPPDQP